MRISLVLFLSLLAGCNAMKRTPPSAYYPPTTDPNFELATNPTIVLSDPQDWAKMTLHGYHLGDDGSIVNPKVIVSSDRGWDALPDGNRLRIGDDGKINAFGLRDRHQLDQLGINTQGDIQKKFGKAQHIIDLNDATIYLYQDQHIHVIWRPLDDPMVSVNVVKRIQDSDTETMK
jgi:hypothetical protein